MTRSTSKETISPVAVADFAPNPIPQTNKRIEGLDTLRFLMAAWVVVGHFGVIPFHFMSGNKLGKALNVAYSNLFSGPAAVIVFFVISGFCIHFPYRKTKQVHLIPYFARRHLRIWIPMGVAVLLGLQVGVTVQHLLDTILWSLFAEEIYYLIYPGLLKLVARFGWSKLLIASYIGAALVILTQPKASNYPSYGVELNWLLGLPCWLLGCYLAEKVDIIHALPDLGKANIWLWRGGAWVVSIICLLLRFHTPLGYPITLTFFGVYIYFWLQNEIRYYQYHKVVKILENFGKASYSIYLLHPCCAACYKLLPLPSVENVPGSVLRFALTFALCSIFYFLVEKPSHLAARQLAKKLSPAAPL